MDRLTPSRSAMLIGALALVWAAMLGWGGPAAEADVRLLLAAQREALGPAARLVTTLGDLWLLLIAAGLGALAAAARRDLRATALIVGITLSVRAIVELQKIGFDRARPDPAGHETAVHSMAYPSGHAADAMAVWLALALLAAPPSWRRPAVAAALAIAVLVGLSRLVLGVHWPSDVIGGWAFGAAWALLALRLFGGTRQRRLH